MFAHDRRSALLYRHLFSPPLQLAASSCLLNLTDPPRVSRRLHVLGGWGSWEDRADTPQRCENERSKQHGVSAQTIYSWRKHVGSLEPSDVKRLRQIEQENGRLKKMVADRDLEIDVIKEITRKNGRRTCAPAAGRVCPVTRSVRPPRVRLALRRTIVVGLPVAAWRCGTRPPWPRCAAWRPSIPATGIAGSGSF